MTGTARSSIHHALPWAVYLAVSWTWCIGMFLPVLLVRDYGIWGFVVFAVPNVIGAGAMGWVLKSGESSEALASVHRRAIRGFSVVTVAFHLYFVWYLTQAGWVSGEWWPWIAIGVFAVAIFSGLRSEFPTEAFTPFLVSALVIVFAFTAGVDVKIPDGQAKSFFGVPAVAWLAPVCVFGFLLCPYLDASFLRARRNVSAPGARLAFGVGFGVLFLSMIVFTLCYAGWLLGLTVAAARVPTAIVLHMLVQAGFTVGIHLRETAVGFGESRAGFRGAAAAWALLGLVAGAAAVFKLDGNDNISPRFEFGYRLFMSAYGLLFPAYVWLVMVPLRIRADGLGMRHIVVWLGACAIAAPAFWMGFIEHKEWWLVPGVLVVLGARAFIPKRGASALPPKGSPVP